MSSTLCILYNGTMSAILNSSRIVLHKIHLSTQFVIGAMTSSLAILISFAGISPLEFLLQSISLIYFIDIICKIWFTKVPKMGA